jgi:hypothetical protein
VQQIDAQLPSVHGGWRFAARWYVRPPATWRRQTTSSTTSAGGAGNRSLPQCVIPPLLCAGRSGRTNPAELARVVRYNRSVELVLRKHPEPAALPSPPIQRARCPPGAPGFAAVGRGASATVVTHCCAPESPGRAGEAPRSSERSISTCARCSERQQRVGLHEERGGSRRRDRQASAAGCRGA